MTTIERYEYNGHIVTMTREARYESRPWFVNIQPPLRTITGEYPATASNVADAYESFIDAIRRVGATSAEIIAYEWKTMSLD